MEIKDKVWCLFEQSGVFKNEFKKLGYDAVDVDIQNNLNETDYQIDLFAEIEKAYDGQPSIFDEIKPDGLIMAFFPCIYFTGFTNPRYFTLENQNYKSLSMKDKFDAIIERANNRNDFYILLYKLVAVCYKNGLRMIFENPYSTQHFLYNNFLQEPAIIDKDRTRRGDYFKKPTGYWFFNCEPTYGYSYSKPKKTMTIINSKASTSAGLCSEERSLIAPEYARNFICDFILGKTQENSQLTLF